jgi:hypothetical protein
MILKGICILSTLFLGGCLSLQKDETNTSYLGYKNIELRGIVNTNDYRLTPQKPPGLDNTIVVRF